MKPWIVFGILIAVLLVSGYWRALALYTALIVAMFGVPLILLWLVRKIIIFQEAKKTA